MAMDAVRVFISYSHKDEALRDSLATHLSNLQAQGIISSWYDRQLTAGTQWDDKIKAEMEAADIILLLISPDFMASKYCREVEIPFSLQRHEAKQAYVVPVILRPLDWIDAPFAKLQAFPKDAKPVTTWPNQDEAFVSVTQGIRTAAKLMQDYRQQKVEQDQRIREQYRHKVEEALSDGVISIVERDTLDELREDLGLTLAVAAEIEAHVYEPHRRYQENLNKYRKTLHRLIEGGHYPLSAEIEQDLTNRQRDLGLKPEDATRISQSILARAELADQIPVEPNPTIQQESTLTSEIVPLIEIAYQLPDVGLDLVHTWQQVLANIEPRGTQALLTQQATLLHFNGKEAQLGIRSQPLFKMLQERLPNVEKAFFKTFGSRIRVSLQVADLPSLSASIGPSSQRKTLPSLTPVASKAQVASTKFDLEDTWQQVLTHLEPRGIQALLTQQGALLYFNGKEAQLGIRSQPLFKMLQERLPNVEEAFFKVFGNCVQVSLQVADLPPLPAPASAPAPINQTSEL
jgi:TIR domain